MCALFAGKTIELVSEPQDKQKPLEQDGPGCESILRTYCWHECNNKQGAGWQVEAGCLVYGYGPELEKVSEIHKTEMHLGPTHGPGC
ncbi:Uncharacterized protein HZ326_28659 [Fusarium oxysporum f. sp. albedinis]|nr:Uncharacterized protein HZ326_28659 [Fusarium oxysporum f. sp. albedinis]